MAGGWRELHKEELQKLYPSPNIAVIISRRIRWAWHVGCMREMRNAYKIFVGKHESERSLVRTRDR